MNAVAPVCRVVLADDAVDIRLLLRMALEGEDRFEIVGEAGDGSEAVTLAASTKPDIMVLDLAMPVMDGLQAIPAIRCASPDTKIVILTGFDSGQFAEAAHKLGAHAYLHKSEALIDIGAVLWEVWSSH